MARFEITLNAVEISNDSEMISKMYDIVGFVDNENDHQEVQEKAAIIIDNHMEIIKNTHVWGMSVIAVNKQPIFRVEIANKTLSKQKVEDAKILLSSTWGNKQELVN
jgi:hypothetical protein